MYKDTAVPQLKMAMCLSIGPLDKHRQAQTSTDKHTHKVHTRDMNVEVYVERFAELAFG